MQSWTKACWASLIAASLVAVAHADDVAVVHISDRPAPVPDPGPGAPATTSAPVANGAACDGAGGVGVGGYLVGNGGWYNPTEGFRPYAAAPVYREAIAYQRYWPDKWYGEPGYNLRPMFPQVYMPTDTTQQGFYYARVPQWMPNPNMYPPAPRPADWHRHVVYAGAGAGACGSVGAGVSAGPVGVGAGTDSGTPTLAPGQSMPSPPMPGQPSPPTSLGNPSAQPVPPPQAMPPSAAIQQDAVQPAAGTTEHHGFILDLMNSFSRNRNQQVAPASGMQQQPQEGQPAQ